jgi:hypothetical protein
VLNTRTRSLLTLTSIESIRIVTKLTIENILSLLHGSISIIYNEEGNWAVVFADATSKNYAYRRLLEITADKTISDENIGKIVEEIRVNSCKTSKVPSLPKSSYSQLKSNIEQLSVQSKPDEIEHEPAPEEQTRTQSEANIIHKTPSIMRRSSRKCKTTKTATKRSRPSRTSTEDLATMAGFVERIKEKEKQEIDKKYYRLLQALRKYY